MGTKQSTNDANVGFKHRNIDVGIEILFGGENVDYSLEFCVISHYG